MSDSRITQAVAEVSAAIELLITARNTMHALLEEDPAFGALVYERLRLASGELFRADVVASNALNALTVADAIENRQTA